MIYMVEMGFTAHALREKWDDWYLGHMKMLVSLPGIHATQRFEALHDHLQPFLAMHEVDGPEVFDSPAYRAKAGPASTGEWRALHLHWRRNLYAGLDHTPEVKLDAFLLVVEDGRQHSVPAEVALHRLSAMGLDRDPPRRFVGVTDQPSVAVRLMDQPGIRVMKPLTPRLLEGDDWRPD